MTTRTMQARRRETVRTSISMDRSLARFALDRASGRGFSTFSGYVQDLIRRDGFSQENVLGTRFVQPAC